jgi:CRP/FNR family transcriptional regulator
MEDSIILEVEFDKFKRDFLSQNILNNEFINEILLKTQQLHCVVNRELVFDASAKVAFMLIDDLDMFNRLKRQEVSFMLHIQPETLSRVLKKLKRADIIDMDNTNIVIKNQDYLKKIYRGEQ